MKVLLVNPSHAGQGNIPVNLPILTAILRETGHSVRVFDFTNYAAFQPHAADRESGVCSATDKFARPEYYFKQTPPPDLEAIVDARREYAGSLGLADRLNPARQLWETDPREDFNHILDDFNPDIVGLTGLTVDINNALAFIEPFCETHDFLLVVGGVHARAVPETLLEFDAVDAICIGDGERAFPEYIRRLALNGDVQATPNMWVRTVNGWVRNEDTWRTEMSALPVPVFDVFDPVHFYRPFDGRLYRMLNYEWNRGCPYTCTFCMNSLFNANLKERYPGRSPVRHKPVDQAIHELKSLIDTYGFDFVRFWDEDFLSISHRRLEAFADQYIKHIELPFLIYSRMESMSPEKLQLLKAMGCRTIATGIESGSEYIRYNILNRRISNSQIMDTLAMVRETGIRASCYNIMGLPDETRCRVFETIRLNRAVPVASVSCTLLEPYPGTPIRRICENDGLDPGTPPDYRCLHGIPQYVPSGMTRRELQGLFKCFQLYVYLPEDYYPEIKRAEADNPEGNRVFRRLMEMKMRDYPEKPLYREDMTR